LVAPCSFESAGECLARLVLGREAAALNALGPAAAEPAPVRPQLVAVSISRLELKDLTLLRHDDTAPLDPDRPV